MDEVEFKKAYDAAWTSAEKIAAPETKTAMMLVIHLINELQEQITEMKIEEDC